ncbi:hypothetical protein M2651_01960 [Clostridium sp. SYSU_GA19001]|uniref:hypothetical protein n=1 Tax=Clostridium caldaquaticum TaxID=2940653 RepID=UPI0020771E56|nr:hypothetical protein [Clostridium caldaquaticum]MCM8709786.1 hypothetical protein [Clostridium caldaquaticum]
MSRKHRHECCYDEKEYRKGYDKCCCDFPTLIILILILLQFNRGGYGLFGAKPVEGVGNYGGALGLVDNSILFIIAIFYLACCNPCKR